MLPVLFMHPILTNFVKQTIMDMINYKLIIKRNPNKRFGKPCVRDTRITVYDVLGWLAAGMTNNEIISDFHELTMDDITACLAYAARTGNLTTNVIAQLLVTNKDTIHDFINNPEQTDITCLEIE